MTSAGASGVGSADPYTVHGEHLGAAVEDGDRIGQQFVCFPGCGGDAVEAGRPREQFHAAFEVDARHTITSGAGRQAAQR